MEEEIDNIKNKLGELESSLIEQEHRFLPLLNNFFNRKNTWQKGDPRRKAAVKALVWRLFFSPVVIAIAGGGIGLMTLIFLAAEIYKLDEQNDLIKEQNNWFQTQITTSEVTNLRNMLYTSNLNPVRTAEVFKDYIGAQKRLITLKNDTLETGLGGMLKISGISLSGTTFQNEPELFRNIFFRDVDFRGVQFINVNFNGSIFENCSFNALVEEGDISPILVKPMIASNCDWYGSIFMGDFDFEGAIIKNCITDESFLEIFSFFKYNLMITDDEDSRNFLNQYNGTERVFSSLRDARKYLKEEKEKPKKLYSASNFKRWSKTRFEIVRELVSPVLAKTRDDGIRGYTLFDQRGIKSGPKPCDFLSMTIGFPPYEDCQMFSRDELALYFGQEEVLNSGN